MLHLLESGPWHFTKLLVRADPKVWMDALGRYELFVSYNTRMTHLAFQEVAHHQIVVHRLRNDLSDRFGRHFDVSVVFGRAGLGSAKKYG
jgi:hypothetical protein